MEHWIPVIKEMPKANNPGIFLNVKTQKGEGVAWYSTDWGFYRIVINGQEQPSGMLVLEWLSTKLITI